MALRLAATTLWAAQAWVDGRWQQGVLLNLGIAALRRWFQSRAQDLVLGVSGAAA